MAGGWGGKGGLVFYCLQQTSRLRREGSGGYGVGLRAFDMEAWGLEPPPQDMGLSTLLTGS